MNFWTGEISDGGQSVGFCGADASEMPLYVRAGSIIPWGPDAQYSTEKQWDSLEVRIHPGADGEFILYEDENDGYNYEQSKSSRIRITWDDAAQTLTIAARKGQFNGMLMERTFNIVAITPDNNPADLHASAYHATVKYDGTELSIRINPKDNPSEISAPAIGNERLNTDKVYDLQGRRINMPNSMRPKIAVSKTHGVVVMR